MGRVAMAHTGILTNTSGHTKLTPECQFVDVTQHHRRIAINVVNFPKHFGGVQAVKAVYLTIIRGEFIRIIGPSGCDKITSLRMIGGFLHSSDGSIVIDGKDVVSTGPDRRFTNMVFLVYGLFPHMTVIQINVYGLRVAKVAKHETERRVRDAIELVHLEGLETRSIADLSGRQQPRVALARAVIMRPQVFLLDEPLAVLENR